MRERRELSITNLEHLATLSPEEAYDLLYWIFNVYAFEFNNSRLGIIEWFNTKYSNPTVKDYNDMLRKNYGKEVEN